MGLEGVDMVSGLGIGEVGAPFLRRRVLNSRALPSKSGSHFRLFWDSGRTDEGLVATDGLTLGGVMNLAGS